MGLQAYPLVFKYPGMQTGSENARGISLGPVPRSARVMEREKAYEDVAEKNLFRPERTRWRPPEEPPPEAEPPPSSPPPPPPAHVPPISLQGVVMTGDKKMALLNLNLEKKESSDTSSSTSFRAAAGDEVGEFLVEAVESDRVVLKWNGRSVVLYVHLREGQKSTTEETPQNVPLILTNQELEEWQLKVKAAKKDEKQDREKRESNVSPSVPAGAAKKEEDEKAASSRRRRAMDEAKWPVRSRSPEQRRPPSGIFGR